MLNAVWRTPLMTWKSPVWNLETISGMSVCHLSGKSCWPMMAIEFDSCFWMAAGLVNIKLTTWVLIVSRSDA